MNFGRAVGLFNKFTPKITKGIGQVANKSSKKCKKYRFNRK